MIAQVVPITRLRRDTSWWSYKIPLRKQLQPGCLVIVPFRGRPCLGVVWHLEEQDDKATETIIQIVTSAPLFRTTQRLLVEHLSEQGLCSLSTALYVSLPTGFRSLPLSVKCRSLLEEYSEKVTTNSQIVAPQHAIMLPSRRPQAVESLFQRFGTSLADLFSDCSADNELEQWFSIALGSTQVAIGRERAITAPWINLRQVTLVEPEDINYYREQTPYLSMVQITQILAKYHAANLNIRTYIPQAAAKQLWNSTEGSTSWPSDLTIVDVSKQPLLSEELLNGIRTALKQNKTALILYNAHDRLAPSQDTELGLSLKLLPGIETMRKQIAQALDLATLPASIVVDTRSQFNQAYISVGFTAVLSIDPLLSRTIFADHLQGCADIGHLFAYQVPCVIQSRHLDHPLLHALRNRQLDTYVCDLIDTQKRNELPPFGSHIICSIPIEKAEKSPQELYDSLLPFVESPWQLSYPFSADFRRKPFMHVMLHAPENTRLGSASRKIITSLKRPWRVQRDPWYIL